MKILLFGYHDAGYRALRALIARGHDVLVVTHPSPPEIPSVAALADALGLKWTTDGVESFLALATEFRPDIMFSVYYRRILSQDILDIPRLGSFNFHPSLLPKHRGCFSAPWAIIDGDRVTGVTCHRMTEKVDAGEIIDREDVTIAETETGLSLYDKLVNTTASLFVRVLDRAETGSLEGTPQEGEGSFHRREVPFDGLIDAQWPRARIDRFIRALYFPPYHPATVLVDGHRSTVRTIEQYDRLMRNAEVSGSPVPEIVAARNRAGTANHPTESVVETSHARRD